MTTDDATTPRRSPAAVVAGLVAVALVGVGVWLLWHSRPTTVGWFAYSPLAETGYTSGTSPSDVVGLVALVVGLLGLGGVGGYALGRRRPRA